MTPPSLPATKTMGSLLTGRAMASNQSCKECYFAANTINQIEAHAKDHKPSPYLSLYPWPVLLGPELPASLTHQQPVPAVPSFTMIPSFCKCGYLSISPYPRLPSSLYPWLLNSLWLWRTQFPSLPSSLYLLLISSLFQQHWPSLNPSSSDASSVPIASIMREIGNLI